MRRWLAWRLRFLADRIHHESAVRCVGLSYVYVRGSGLVVHWHGVSHHLGIPLWAWGEDRDQAYCHCPKAVNGHAYEDGCPDFNTILAEGIKV